jgi:predicted P-loop ATPase
MSEPLVSKSVYKVLTDLTGEPRFEVALHLATKELVQFKAEEVEEQIQHFERRYQMDFDHFKQAWDEERIADKHSYEVERDYWEWEAAMTNQERLQEILNSPA